MKTEKRKEYGLKQLNIEIPLELLEEIKTKARRRNIPTRTYVMRSIISALRMEK